MQRLQWNRRIVVLGAAAMVMAGAAQAFRCAAPSPYFGAITISI